MDSKGVGKLWWDTSAMDTATYRECSLYYGVHKTDRAPGFLCVALGSLLETDEGYEYIHYGQEILSVLTYEGMSLVDAKTAVETAVRLTCDLGAKL